MSEEAKKEVKGKYRKNAGVDGEEWKKIKSYQHARFPSGPPPQY